MLVFLTTACKEEKVKLKYEYGSFPDSVFNLSGINSEFDDYNMDLPEEIVGSSIPVIFSSNRKSSGGQFDLVYGNIGYTFNRVSGEFYLESGMFSETFYETLTTKFNTAGNDFGPNRMFCHEDGFEYMFAASEDAATALDIEYSKYSPYISTVPSIPSPVKATLFNTSSNDAYVCFNATIDTAWFCSDRDGNFDIFSISRPSLISFSDWMTTASGSANAVAALNTSGNEKCPYVSEKVMLFTSDRDGGFGGWDLYYSVLSGGVWSEPVNMGEDFNTEYNEYRPVIGTDIYFTNKFILFSSDRPGGEGGYDLYLGPLITE